MQAKSRPGARTRTGVCSTNAEVDQGLLAPPPTEPGHHQGFSPRRSQAAATGSAYCGGERPTGAEAGAASSYAEAAGAASDQRYLGLQDCQSVSQSVPELSAWRQAGLANVFCSLSPDSSKRRRRCLARPQVETVDVGRLYYTRSVAAISHKSAVRSETHAARSCCLSRPT
jgi:hypothetical protein